MPEHSEQHKSPYTSRQLYDLVRDVKRYPEFLPWVSAARIIEESDTEMKAQLMVKYKGFRESYTSQITLHAPEGENGSSSILVEMIEGPFEHLTNHWKFDPAKTGGKTNIDFYINFKFKAKLLEALINKFFEGVFLKMLTAFEERADELYGK